MRSVVLLICAAALTVNADEGAWVRLFDGQTMTGWKVFNGEGLPTRGWEIKDGTLHALPIKISAEERPEEMAPCLATVDNYTDFDLTFEWKISQAGNGGVFYANRMDKVKPGNYRVHSSRGQEYQILDDIDSPFGKSPTQAAAAHYGHQAAVANKPLKPAGEWNTGRIVVRGLHVEHWLNGMKVVEYDLAPEDKVTSPIVLQHHHDEAWYRNIRIKRLN